MTTSTPAAAGTPIGHRRRGSFLAAMAAGAIIIWTVSTASASGSAAARARIVDGGGATIGWALLTEDGDGRLHLNVQVDGISPGRHGIHLHAVGSCVGPAFASAGGHHNPLGATHGLDSPTGAHAGDLPNLQVNVAGRGHLDAVSDRATLSMGPVSLLDADGSAIIIHAAEDDQITNPTGNSGARIACGVIEATR
jgi:Cu-Zn family superoxide dismutase